MTKERSDFDNTPLYDDFLELREDLICRFIELYDPDSVGTSGSSREELEKMLHKFEVENQEQIIYSRNSSDERKRRKIEEIIEKEGTFFDRVNVDYHERGSVLDHELAVQYADLLSKNAKGENHHASADLLNRKTRLIQQSTTNQTTVPAPTIARASGCSDLWKQRALETILKSFS